MASSNSPRWTFPALFFYLTAGIAGAGEPPTIPVGLDAYRQWDRWPSQRIGARAYMRSTYDRRAGNEGADASHFLYQVADDFNVVLDVEGPGVLYFARYNHWHGSPWHYEVDGTDHIVRETSTADPDHPAGDSVFLPREPFPNPLTWTWATTKGADLMWVPLPFEKSFRMAYSRTRYGTGYYIFHQYVPGAPLSRPIKSWDGQSPPDKDVLDLVARAGTDLVPRADSPEGARSGIRERSGTVTLPSKGAVTLAEITQAPSTIRALEFDVPAERALEFGRATLRVTWDGRPGPSIEAPVALFHGAGTLYNRDDREYLVKGFPAFIRFAAGRVRLACFFPMPFFRSARIELVNSADDPIADVRWSARYGPCREPAGHLAYFHATYRDHATPEPGKDLVLLDTREAEGGGHWSGSFVGTSFIFSDRAVLNTLEGDPRFFFDDSMTPQAQGTGTEEWGGGGDYWGGRNMTLPFAGHPVGAPNPKEARSEEDKIQSAYRFLLADLMPFGRNARIQLEHGGVNESTEHYRTVTYWYGSPGASLVPTDTLQVGDAESERSHRYQSPQASEPYTITSRYELGPDSARVPERDDGPRADPEDFAEFEFAAGPDKAYTIWVRGKNLDGDNASDAFWMQFDDDIGTTRRGAGYSHPKGFGNWLDRFPAGTYAWSSALPQDPPRTITFERGGKHRLRIQPRHPRHVLDRIWLSTSQKTLPEPSREGPERGQGTQDVVLNAADAARVQGKINPIDDAKAASGRALSIGGKATMATIAARTVEYFPSHTDRGRKTAGVSEFNLDLDPKNVGVMLRRKLDYALPNQRAQVFVADAGRPGVDIAESDWKPAGTWYLAGSNTCVYSNPKEELGATQHLAQTSNRRFRDDEFLLPRALTAGRSAIRVRVRFTPVRTPLFPGEPLPELAWSEIRYTAYCWVMPDES